jgi:hypothetical protein
MTEELGTRTRTPSPIVEKLIYRDDPFPSLWWTSADRSTDRSIAQEDTQQLGVYARWVLDLLALDLPPGARAAILGGGTFVLPRLLSSRFWGALDVYEIEPHVVEWARNRWPAAPWQIIEGDYRETLKGPYDVIIEDTGEAVDMALLQANLAPGGVLIGVPDLHANMTGV